MKGSETLLQVAAAKPSHGASDIRYEDPEQRRILLTRILSEDRSAEKMDHETGSPRIHLPTPSRGGRRGAIAVGAVVVGIALFFGLSVGTSSPGSRNPALPVIVIEQPSEKGLGLPVPVYPYLMSLTAGSGLSTSTGSEPIFRIAWPDGARASAVRLAHVFGVSGPQTNGVQGGITFGPPSGPAVVVIPEDGILTWTYEGSPTVRAPLEGRSTGTQAGVPPSDSWATRQTKRYLAALGMATHLGKPQISNFRGQVGVNVSITLDSIEANEQFEFIYGLGDTLEMATGVFGDFTLLGHYPTSSPVSAVTVLESETHYAPSEDLTDCPKNSQGTPVCSGSITSANLGYRYAATPSGGEVLIPEWFLQGPQAGGNPDARIIGGVVPAMKASYFTIRIQRNGASG
jgi:hypothetical protein